MLKGAIVGAGRLGRIYARVISEHPDARLVAVCDTDPTRLGCFGSETGVETTQDVRDIAGSDVDFVYVGTPDFAHVEPAICLAAGGKGLLLEKPLAMSTEDARRIADAARPIGDAARVCFTNRWNPPFVAAKREIDQGAIGQVVSVHIRLNDRREVPSAMLSWAAQTSPGWFLMAHTADLARWFVGDEASQVFGCGQKGVLRSRYGVDTYDSLNAVIRFRGGATAFLESNWILPDSYPFLIDFRAQILGAEGVIQIDAHDQMVKLSGAQHGHLSTIDMPVGPKLIGQISYFFDDYVGCLLGRREASCTLDDGVANTRIVEAVHRAADGGGRVIKL